MTSTSHRYSFPVVRELREWTGPQTRAGVIRAVVIDDHPLTAGGLRALLATMPGMELAGAASRAEALELCHARQPRLIVIDVGSLGADGLTLTRELRSQLPDARILALSAADDDMTVFGALRAGAHGYVLKDAGEPEIKRALSAVAAGEAVFGAGVSARVLAQFGGQAPDLPDPLCGLSAREREVLDLLARGLGTKEIARRLFLSPKTVRNHIANIVSKRQLADRAHAIAYARQNGLGRG